jgi:hypothetical protein
MFVFSIAAVAAAMSSVRTVSAGVSPAIAGNGATDSVWVEFAVNDTLGNATDADSVWVIRFYRQWVVDSIKITVPVRTGFYRQAFRSAMHADSLGGYSFNVRAFGVSGQLPHTSYAYTVVNGGPVGNDDLARVIADSNLARDATKADYQSTTGPGAIPVYVHCLSAQDSTSIQGVRLNVLLAADHAPKHRTMSAGDGWAAMTLEEYDHVVYATANNYFFAVPACTLIVDGDSLRDTIWATAFDPGSPGSAELCRVYSWIYDVAGVAVEDASITARLVGIAVRYGDVVVSPYEKSTTTDSNGYWFVDVLPNVCLTPDTVLYEFTLRQIGGPILRQTVSVPDTTAWLLSW